jgi:hypothetical protein
MGSVADHVYRHQNKYRAGLAIGAMTLVMKFILFPLARLLSHAPE